MNASRLGLLIALVVTLAATWYAASLDDESADALVDVSEVASRRTPTPRPASEPDTALADSTVDGSTNAAGLREPLPQRVAGNLFAAHSWQPPLPPPPVAAPALAPRAPALPFRYLGRMEDGDQVVVFLMDGKRELVVRQGDQLPNYRIDEINRRGMRLTYLPLNETQRMLFGSSD